MTETIVFLVLGLIIGFVGGYAGIGGAPFLIALSILLLDLNQYEAQGTVIAVMLGPMSLLGTIVMKDRVKVLWKYILIGFISYAIFSYFGAILAFSMEESKLQILFGLLLIILGLIDLTRRNNIENIQLIPNGITFQKGIINVNYFSVSFISIIVGIIGGLFGIGAGVIMLPIFINLMKIHKDDARAMSLAILLPPVSIGAVIKYNQENAVNWHGAMILFIAYFLTNHFGAIIGKRHSEKKFKVYYGIITLLLGISYLIILF